MRIRGALRAGAFAIVSGLGAAVSTGAAQAGPVVLELFSSQGCPNCPAADALFAEYIDREGVIAVSLLVDYWNYLGWQDTLGRAEHTQRWMAYARARGDGQVYTPQIVVSGRTHVVGSDRAAIEAAIAVAADLPTVDMAIVPTIGGLQVNIGAAAPGMSTWGTLWLLMFDNEETVEIGRGENAGRTVTYHRPVVGMHGLAMWRGEAMSIEIPLLELSDVGADGAVVILQQILRTSADTNVRLPGPILGAAIYNIR